MKFILVTILSLIFSSITLAGELNIYVTAPAKKLDWASNAKLTSSFTRSYLESMRQLDHRDWARGAIGHAAAHIQCGDFNHWSSLSIPTKKIIPNMLQGPKALLKETSGAYVQSSIEIERLIAATPLRTRKLTVKFNSSHLCQDLRRFVMFHKGRELVFSPMIDTLEAFERQDGMGGTGTTWVVALLKMVRPSFRGEKWLQDFDGHRFYDPQKMFDNLNN